MRKGKVGFGIVGCGVIGPWHAKAISMVPQAELVALCDVEIEKARRLAAEYGGVPCYDNHRKMLKKETNVDCVCVCTPSGLHWRIAVDAAKAGRHVLSEKPIDITLRNVDRMIEASRKSRTKLGCIFQRRTRKVSHVVREAVQSGQLGQMVVGDAYLKYYRSPEYYKSADWRATWEWDGGTWTLTNTGGPSPRVGHAMAYDAHRRAAVLFGGMEGGPQVGDTWEYGLAGAVPVEQPIGCAPVEAHDFWVTGGN